MGSKIHTRICLYRSQPVCSLIELRELDEHAEAKISQNNRSHVWQLNPHGSLTDFICGLG